MSYCELVIHSSVFFLNQNQPITDPSQGIIIIILISKFSLKCILCKLF